MNTLWAIFNNMAIEENFLLILGIIAYLFCVLMIFLGRYAEGEGALINLANKLIRKELKPAEFIKHYEGLKNADDLAKLLKSSFEKGGEIVILSKFKKVTKFYGLS